MNQLFSEIYGLYYSIASKLLTKATDGITNTELEKIIGNEGFSETAFHMMPALIDGEWSLLAERDGILYSKLADSPQTRPLTYLEKSWLAALLTDTRIKLFIGENKLKKLSDDLAGIPPLFSQSDFFYTDRNNDGDDYENPLYIENFREVLSACKNKYSIEVEYQGEKQYVSKRIYHPYKICYSSFNDKFRLLCAAYNSKKGTLNRITLNIGRICSVKKADTAFNMAFCDIENLFAEPQEQTVTLEISTQRNALERFMLQFASCKRQTDYDPARNIYTCHLSYDISEETEILIRILSFGPAIKVLGPESFLGQVKARIAKQIRLLKK